MSTETRATRAAPREKEGKVWRADDYKNLPVGSNVEIGAGGSKIKGIVRAVKDRKINVNGILVPFSIIHEVRVIRTPGLHGQLAEAIKQRSRELGLGLDIDGEYMGLQDSHCSHFAEVANEVFTKHSKRLQDDQQVEMVITQSTEPQWKLDRKDRVLASLANDLHGIHENGKPGDDVWDDIAQHAYHTVTRLNKEI
jgi:hypothetical protein